MAAAPVTGIPRLGGVLVVCTANVCRSPMAELAIRRRFGQLPGFEVVPVASAGLRVADGSVVCDAVEGFGDDPQWRLMAGAHRPRAFEPDQARQAALVLSATRELRSALVAALPECRASVFTLREAVWLGQGYVRDAATPAAASVEAFRAHLDAMRGLLPLPEPPLRRLRRTVADAFDIPDEHGRRAARHSATLRSAFGAASELAGRIAGASR